MADIEKLRQLHKDRSKLQGQKLEELITQLEERMEICAPYHTSILIIFPKPGHAYGQSNGPGVPSRMLYSVCTTDTAMREYITEGIKEKYQAEGFKVTLDKEGDITISWAY